MKAKEQIPVYWYNATDSQLSRREAVCPYCQHEDDQIWEHDLRQETPAEILCESCEKSFYIEMEAPRYTTWTKELITEKVK